MVALFLWPVKQCGADSGNIRLVVAEIALTAPRLRAAVRKISPLEHQMCGCDLIPLSLKLDCFKQSSCQRRCLGAGVERR
jgi:hypothetical protein